MRTAIFGLGVILFLAGPSAAEKALNVDSLASLGIDLVHQVKFDSALAELNRIIVARPDEPEGYFFIAATYQTIIDDFRADRYKDKFDHYIDLAIQKARGKLQADSRLAYDYFYAGAALGYRGIFRAFHGDWWGAFWDGGKAKSMMEHSLELDSTLYDAYYGLGTYNYWRSAKTKTLWWLPFFGDNRAKGIEYTKLAIRKGNIAKVEGKYALMRIYAEEKDWRQVLAWYDSVKAVNPAYPFCLWLIGQAYINLEQPDSARQVFSQLLSVEKSSGYFDLASEMEVRYYFGLIDFNQKDYDKALSEIGFVLANKKHAEENEYAKNTLNLAEDLRKKIYGVQGLK